MKWQPIETAPKDEWVLVCGPEWQVSGEGIFKKAWADAEGQWKWQNSEMLFVGDDAPTHWMPLPLPPQPSGQIEEPGTGDERTAEEQIACLTQENESLRIRNLELEDAVEKMQEGLRAIQLHQSKRRK